MGPARMIRRYFARDVIYGQVGLVNNTQGVAGFPALMEFDCCSAFGKGPGMKRASSNA